MLLKIMQLNYDKNYMHDTSIKAFPIKRNICLSLYWKICYYKFKLNGIMRINGNWEFAEQI